MNTATAATLTDNAALNDTLAAFDCVPDNTDADSPIIDTVANLLRKNKIVAIRMGGNDYLVESKSGSTYRVTYRGSYGNDHVHTWECDCPAGSYGRDCRHVKTICAISSELD